MKILIWHVHGSWLNAFVRGTHEYYLPLVEGRAPEGRGRAQTWTWPPNVFEIDAETSRRTAYDLVIFQNPLELETYAPTWLGSRRPGRDLPMVYLEHNAPDGNVADMRHPLKNRCDLRIVHVTEFNELFWDCGSTRTSVIEHAVVDPGYRFTGELARSAVVINEAARRGRMTGTDLLPVFAEAAPLDLFGMDAARLGGVEDLPQDRLHDEIARRRVYIHPNRWTSLGLSLIEAMYVGLPVVALASTAVVDAVPPRTGVTSTSLARLIEAVRRFVQDLDFAREVGLAARAYARERFALPRFLAQWDDVMNAALA